jgi:hypothetical protein
MACDSYPENQTNAITAVSPCGQADYFVIPTWLNNQAYSNAVSFKRS